MISFRRSGFTLLEVLVASFILFLVVSTASIVFSGAVKSKVNAEKAALAHGYKPLIAEHIATFMKMGKTSGRGSFLEVNYAWSAKSQSQKPIVSLYNDLNGAEPGQSQSSGTGKKAILWLVTVTMEGSEAFSFNVTTWS